MNRQVLINKLGKRMPQTWQNLEKMTRKDYIQLTNHIIKVKKLSSTINFAIFDIFDNNVNLVI